MKNNTSARIHRIVWLVFCQEMCSILSVHLLYTHTHIHMPFLRSLVPSRFLVVFLISAAFEIVVFMPVFLLTIVIHWFPFALSRLASFCRTSPPKQCHRRRRRSPVFVHIHSFIQSLDPLPAHLLSPHPLASFLPLPLSLGQFNEQNTSLNHFHVSFTWLIPLERGCDHSVQCTYCCERDTVVIRFVNAVIFFWTAIVVSSSSSIHIEATWNEVKRKWRVHVHSPRVQTLVHFNHCRRRRRSIVQTRFIHLSPQFVSFLALLAPYPNRTNPHPHHISNNQKYIIFVLLFALCE